MQPEHSLLRHYVLPFLLLAFFAASTAQAQTNAYPYPYGAGPSSGTNASGRGSSNSSAGRGPGFDSPGLDPNLAHRQIVSRREEARKRMAENAARLLTLTRDLQADLQTREANDADAKRLDEIAKLARAVRDQMRQ